MNDLQQHFRRFLGSEIPAGELERHDLHLEPGASFMDALAVRAAQLAQTSEHWAELARQFEGIRGNRDG